MYDKKLHPDPPQRVSLVSINSNDIISRSFSSFSLAFLAIFSFETANRLRLVEFSSIMKNFLVIFVFLINSVNSTPISEFTHRDEIKSRLRGFNSDKLVSEILLRARFSALISTFCYLIHK